MLLKTNYYFQKNNIYFIYMSDIFFRYTKKLFFFRKYSFFNIFYSNYNFFNRYLWSLMLVKYRKFFVMYKKKHGVCFFEDASKIFHNSITVFFYTLLNKNSAKKNLSLKLNSLFMNLLIENNLVFSFFKFYFKYLELKKFK